MRPALRYHGGKYRLAPWVMQFFPPHTCYVEPFGGAAGVLIQKPRSYAEVYNDLDGEMVNFFRVVRDQDSCAALIRALALTPYARAEFDLAFEPCDDPVERARRTAVRAQMGFGSAGATKGVTGFRTDTKRECSSVMGLWAEYPESIRDLGVRFSGVLIEHRDAVDVIRQHDAPDTLYFVDPPYVLNTRVLGGSQRYYRHEMDDAAHLRLLEALREVDGYVVLTGYETAMYREALRDWTMHTTEARISAYRGTGKRTECAWINPACAAALAAADHQARLFA